ncbi:MAG: lysylphosphatidylglycerol synthase domain-containing protein [Gemmatimonadota bacterium]
MNSSRVDGTLPRWAVRALQLILTVAVTWFILDRVGITTSDIRGLEERWLRPSAGVLALASAVFLGGLFLSAAFWGRMVGELGGPKLSFFRSASIYFPSNLGRYIPGKVWQLAGLAYLAKREGVPAATATAAAVLVQAVSLAGAIVIGAWALATTPGVAGGWGRWGAGAILLVVAVTTTPPVFRRLLGLWFRLAGRIRLSGWGGLAEGDGEDGEEGGMESAEGSGVGRSRGEDAPNRDQTTLGGPTFGPRWVVLFAGNWVLYSASFWLMARSFDVDGSFLVLAPAFAAAYVLGYAMIFAPAGIGVREGFLVAFLQPSVGGAAAVALAVLARFWMTLLELLPAVAFGSVHLLRTRGVTDR